jgi:hypothetical protein
MVVVVHKKIGLALILILGGSVQTMQACGPLDPCTFSLQVHGGVLPIVWSGRHNDWVNEVELPSFRHLFKEPWTIGGKIGYNWAEWVEVYVEVDYASAHGKECITFEVTCPSSVNGNATISESLSKYSAVGLYGGSRFYWNSCWQSCGFDRASFFLGTKVGFLYHKQIDVAISATSSAGNSVPVVVPMFFRTNTVSAGLNLGMEWDLWCNFSLVLTGEVVANGGLRENPIICLGTPIPGINAMTALVGGFSTEVWFPITLGLKYTF